jgi:pyruvate/2-oxoglutarate dehydrogenase complex dihydrolipoamide dehydrogenase (E3) component
MHTAIEPTGDRLRLLQAVHPSGWVNPTPAPKYDLVVLGGGTAGLVSAMAAAGLGARVALIERGDLGGDCLHTGCVPSKALLRSARVIGELKRAPQLGVHTGDVRTDFTRIMQRLRERRVQLAAHDSADRLQHAGVDLFFGAARFADANTVQVVGQRLRFRRAVIATGGRPATPPVSGIDTIPFLTNETVFDLTTLPRRLLVLGAGPIGCELGQAFARFGAEVTLVDRSPQVLPREDASTAAIVAAALVRDGVRLVLGTAIERADTRRDEILLRVARVNGREDTETLIGDRLLVAAGRTANVEDLGLDAAHVRVDTHGVIVNSRLQTSNRRIYASGDVCSAHQFTHAADAQSRLVVQNALFFGRRRASALVMPWVTFTDPEVAHVGVTHAEAAASGGRIEALTVALSDVDRAVIDDATDGFVRVYHERGRLRGCTIVAAHAGEMIGEAAYAVTHGGTLGALSSTIHPYPTQAEALRKAGDLYRRQSLTPAVRRWLERYFRWTR